MRKAIATVGLVSLLLSGCTPTQHVVVRSSNPPNLAPGLSGAPVALATEAYPILARLANELSRGVSQSALSTDYNRISDRCDREIDQLTAWSAGSTADDRRRQSLVLAGCRLVLARKMDPGSIDRILGLFALALSADQSPLPPADKRV